MYDFTPPPCSTPPQWSHWLPVTLTPSPPPPPIPFLNPMMTPSPASCPIACLFLYIRIQYISILQNGNLDSTSAPYSKFFSLHDSLIVHNVGSVYHRSSKKFGQDFFLYFQLFFRSIVYLVVLKVFTFYQYFKVVIWTAILPVIPCFFCPELFCCPQCCRCISLVLKKNLGSTFSCILIRFPVP